MKAAQESLCVAGPHVVAPKSPPVVLWFVIGCYPNSRLPLTNSRPTHNWRGFGRHYMGSSNTQEPLCLYPCPANHKIFLEGPYLKTVSIRDLTLSKHSLWHWIFSSDTIRTMVQKYSILHVSISQHFIALGFLIQTRASKWLNCFEAEFFCFTPTLIE